MKKIATKAQRHEEFKDYYACVWVGGLIGLVQKDSFNICLDLTKKLSVLEPSWQ